MVRRRERGNPLGAGKWSHGETLAALGPSGIDDAATANGLHAGTKAMGTHPFDLARLVCSFHKWTAPQSGLQKGEDAKPAGYSLSITETMPRKICDRPF